MNGRQIINECINLITMCCEYHNVAVPDIYFIQKTKENFILRDAQANIISYDPRDVGRTVSAIAYVKNENALYINLSSMKEDLYRRVMCFRVGRQIYEQDQVAKYRESNFDRTNLDTNIVSWNYCYETLHINSEKIAHPLDLDRSIFAEIMMKEVFNVKVNFKGEYFEERYDEYYKTEKMRFNFYKLNDLLIKYGYMNI